MTSRTHRLDIRLSPAELAELEAKAASAGLSKSALVREHIGRVRVIHPAGLQELVRQVARAGNNLNQLARWANTYRSAAEAALILRALKQIHARLAELQASLERVPEPGSGGEP